MAATPLADRILSFDPATGVLRAEAGLSLRDAEPRCSCRAASSPRSRRARSSSRSAAWSRPTCTARTTTRRLLRRARAARCACASADGRIVECSPERGARPVPRHARRHGPHRPHPRGRVHDSSACRRRGSGTESERVPDIDAFIDGAEGRPAPTGRTPWAGSTACRAAAAWGAGILMRGPLGRPGRGAGRACRGRRCEPSRAVRAARAGVLSRWRVRAFNEADLPHATAPRAEARASCTPSRSSIRSTPSATGTACTARAASRSTSACCRTSAGPGAARRFLELLTPQGRRLVAVRDQGLRAPRARACCRSRSRGISIALDIADPRRHAGAGRRAQRARDRGRRPHLPGQGRVHARRSTSAPWSRASPEFAARSGGSGIPTGRLRSAQSVRVLGDRP